VSLGALPGGGSAQEALSVLEFVRALVTIAMRWEPPTWRIRAAAFVKVKRWFAATGRQWTFPPRANWLGIFFQQEALSATSRGAASTCMTLWEGVNGVCGVNGVTMLKAGPAWAAVRANLAGKKESVGVMGLPEGTVVAAAEHPLWGSASLMFFDAKERAALAAAHCLLAVMGRRPAGLLRMAPPRGHGRGFLKVTAGRARADAESETSLLFMKRKNARGGGTSSFAAADAWQSPDVLLGTLCRLSATGPHVGNAACRCPPAGPGPQLRHVLNWMTWDESRGRIVSDCSKAMTTDAWRPLWKRMMRSLAVSCGYAESLLEPSASGARARLTLYSARHSMGERTYAATRCPLATAEALGNSSVESAMPYARRQAKVDRLAREASQLAAWRQVGRAPEASRRADVDIAAQEKVVRDLEVAIALERQAAGRERELGERPQCALCGINGARQRARKAGGGWGPCADCAEMAPPPPKRKKK